MDILAFLYLSLFLQIFIFIKVNNALLCMEVYRNEQKCKNVWMFNVHLYTNAWITKMHKNNNHVSWVCCPATSVGRIRIIWPDPDPLQETLIRSRIRILTRIRIPGSGSGSTSKWSGSEKLPATLLIFIHLKNITYPAHLQDVEEKCLAPNKILFLFKDLTRSIYLFLSR